MQTQVDRQHKYILIYQDHRNGGHLSNEILKDINIQLASHGRNSRPS